MKSRNPKVGSFFVVSLVNGYSIGKEHERDPVRPLVRTVAWRSRNPKPKNALND